MAQRQGVWLDALKQESRGVNPLQCSDYAATQVNRFSAHLRILRGVWAKLEEILIFDCKSILGRRPVQWVDSSRFLFESIEPNTLSLGNLDGTIDHSHRYIDRVTEMDRE
jgi:hypothetical protein